MRKDNTYKAALSVESCRVIYQQITTYDSVIAKQQQLIDNALIDLREAQDKMADAFAARDHLAKELDAFAPEDFLEPDAQGAVNVEHVVTNLASPPPVAPHSGYAPSPFGAKKRAWHKDSPLPKRTFHPKTSPVSSFDDSEY